MNRTALLLLCSLFLVGTPAVSQGSEQSMSLCSSKQPLILQGLAGSALVISLGTEISTCIMASASYGEGEIAVSENDRKLLRKAGDLQLAAAILQVLPSVFFGYLSFRTARLYYPDRAPAIGASVAVLMSAIPVVLDGVAGDNLGFVIGNDAVQNSTIRINQIGAYVNACLSAVSMLLISGVTIALWDRPIRPASVASQGQTL